MTDLPVVYGAPPKDLCIERIDSEEGEADCVTEREPEPKKKSGGRRKGSAPPLCIR